MTPYPAGVMPYPIADYIIAGAKALGCDPAYIAVPMLPVLASAIGNTRKIGLKQTWSEPAVIWAATVGESGTVKTPAWELATRPAWRRQRRLLKDYVEQRKQFDSEVEEWKATDKKIRGAKPESPPPCQHVVCNDITVEALADRLLATPRGTLVALDELAGWFASFDRYKTSSDVPHWLTMHGARSLKVDRKSGDRPTIYVPHAAVSVTGTVQPSVLKTLIGPFFDCGLAARLLVAAPDPTAKRWTDHEIDGELDNAVSRLFDALYALQPAPGVDGYDEPVSVRLAPDALSRWAGFVNDFNEEIRDTTGHTRSSLAKLEGYAARFALILHCVRQAAGEKQSDYIDENDIDGGITLTRWFQSETLRVYRIMHQTQEQRERSELLAWIVEHGGRVTARDVQRGLRRYRETPDQAEADLNTLANEGLGAWQTTRKTSIFHMAEHPDFPFQKSGDSDTCAKNNGKMTHVSPSPRPGA